MPEISAPGPSAWLDVTAHGAACDSTTNDTAAIQAALNAASKVSGTVFTPHGKTCVVSTLNLDGFIGVKVIGGFGGNPQSGNVQSSWRFTGTCATPACLSMRSTQAVSFRNIQLSFPSATAGPMVDLSRSPMLKADSTFISFDGVAFSGPAKSVGPIVLDQNTDDVTFDGWTTFANASVFVSGPTNNSSGYSDKTVFNRVQFNHPGIAAIENASINWTISNSVLQTFLPGATCTPALQYVNGYTNEQALLVIGNVVNTYPGNCTNSFIVFSLPEASGNLGGATFMSNLFISGTAAGKQTVISAANNQVLTVSGNVFNHVGTAVSVGSGVSVDIGPNVYSDVTTQISGNPSAGRAVLVNGNSIVYSGISVGPGKPLTSSGNGGTMPSVVASGRTSMTTGEIAAGTCANPVATAAAGVQSTDSISFSFNAPVGSNPGLLIVHSWPTADNVNFVYCNPTTASVTPSAAALNWSVER